MKPASLLVALLGICCAATGTAPEGDLVPVLRQVSRMIDLPGEIQPFLSVSLHAKFQAMWTASW